MTRGHSKSEITQCEKRLNRECVIEVTNQRYSAVTFVTISFCPVIILNRFGVDSKGHNKKKGTENKNFNLEIVYSTIHDKPLETYLTLLPSAVNEGGVRNAHRRKCKKVESNNAHRSE